jgi:membrane-associated phospholipid phosphatase
LRTASTLELRLWIVAAVCVGATLALGALVASRPPTRLDIEAGALRGTAVPLALFFTALGRWPALLAFGLIAAGVALRLRTGLGAVGLLVGAQVLSQGANGLLKLLFGRSRPDAWLHIQEHDLSYPSGHAVTAIVFFAGLALLAWHAPLPRSLSITIVVVLGICAAGLPWSRLALSAHYLTDVLGGLLLGTAFLCAALALIVRTGGAIALR